MFYVEYRITNLQELKEMCEAIQAEASVDAGRTVHPSEILVQGAEYSHVDFVAKSSALSDGSTVYDVEA